VRVPSSEALPWDIGGFLFGFSCFKLLLSTLQESHAHDKYFDFDFHLYSAPSGD